MKKLKYVMVGVCPNCHKELIRPAECTRATCDCSSVNLIELQPALILPPKTQKKIERLAKSVNASIDVFVDALLEKAVEAYSRRLRNCVTSGG